MNTHELLNLFLSPDAKDTDLLACVAASALARRIEAGRVPSLPAICKALNDIAILAGKPADAIKALVTVMIAVTLASKRDDVDALQLGERLLGAIRADYRCAAQALAELNHAHG